MAPEVLHRSYGTEADMWSIGVIAYILLCGSRPFWARTESGIFRAVLKADPSFDEAPWPSLSPEAIDFVKRLLNKDYRKRLTAAQALSKSLINYFVYNYIGYPCTLIWKTVFDVCHLEFDLSWINLGIQNYSIVGSLGRYPNYLASACIESHK